MAEAKFVNGKYTTGKIATKSGDVDKGIDDYSNMLYSQGQGKTDIGSKMVGAGEQIAGGDWLGGIASGLAGGMDYMGSSQGKQILAGTSKDQDIANAYMSQVGDQKAEEEKRQQAYGDILGQQQKLQADMEMAKMAAQGRANQGTGKTIEYSEALTMGQKLGLKGDELNKYAQKLQGQDPSAAASLGVEERPWYNPFASAKVRENAEYKGGGTPTRTANLPK